MIEDKILKISAGVCATLGAKLAMENGFYVQGAMESTVIPLTPILANYIYNNVKELDLDRTLEKISKAYMYAIPSYTVGYTIGNILS